MTIPPVLHRLSPARLTAPLLLLALLPLTACGGEPAVVEEVPEEASVIELADLGLTFAAIPAGFEIESQSGDSLVLEEAAPEADGRMWLTAGERSDFGIDLVQVVTDQTAVFEAMNNAEYFGGRKLMVPAAGEAYYVRGRFDDDGGARREEARVFLVSPSDNRLLTFHYAYPAAEDSADRIQQLFTWVGEIGVLDFPEAEQPAEDPA